MKKNCRKIKLFGLVSTVVAMAGLTGTALGQELVYSQDFDTDTTADWLVNITGNGYSYADFYFDYSTVGIPPAPHSTGGVTRGLKLGANLGVSTIDGVFPAGISVSPLGFGITENFEMHFDIWLNFVKSGNGSTELGGAGYGTAGTTAQVAGVADSIFISASTDGGTGSDYRVYAPDRQISYQDADHVIRTDTTTPLVYAAGSRNNIAAYYTTNFSPQNLVFPATPVPEAQASLFPRQAGATSPAGAAGFRWHDASLKKVANTITYSIDGLLIATVDVRDAASGGLGGTNILFNFYDINAGGSTDEDATNLQFVLFDNVRITNFSNVVSVDTATPTISEDGSTPGVFTITRTSAGVPLTVNYTISGSASNGVDYATLSGSVTFQATDTSTNIVIVPVNDSIAEVTEKVVLSINPSAEYIGAGSATINITDNETPQLALSTVYSQTYERSYDYARFKVTRLGDLSSSFNVNLTYEGSATSGVDYTGDTTVTFNPDEGSVTFDVHPIDDSDLEGNETIIAKLAPAGAGEYGISAEDSATATIVDAATPAETVLFSDNFNTDTTGNWTQLFAAAPDQTPDYLTIFNYDYGYFSGVPSAPHSAGDTLGLYMTVNKNDPTAAAAALNLYPIGQSFSGNYALRFDMFLLNGGDTASTEYALFGLNHSGTKTNWFRNSPGGVGTGWTFDGVFYDIEADGAASGDYVSYSAPTTAGNNPTALTSTNASKLTGVFKSPPWAVAGAPSNLQGTTTPMWAEVEVSQLNNVLTLKINNTVIFSQTNSTGFTNGNIMIGYEDAYDSIGSANAGVIYDNVRVVALVSQEVHISQIQKVGGNIQIDFTADGASASDFTLLSSAQVNGTYTDAGAAITNTGGNNYRATVAVNGDTRFYQIQRQ